MMTNILSIDRYIENIIDEFDFDTRKISHPDVCSCYKSGNPCHNMPELNCFLCYCPEYDTNKPEGGCKLNSQDGKWLFSKKLPASKIWDCSGCLHPHKKETVRAYLRKLFRIRHHNE